MINSNLGPISHRFRDTATYSLERFIENCRQTAADGDMVTTDSLSKVASALSDGTIVDPLRQIFSNNTAQLVYHSALNPLRSSKVIGFHVI